MNIGILRETQSGEHRIALLPEAVGALVAAGAAVAMEKDAGARGGFADTAFVRAGVEVRPSAAAVLRTADLVIKVKGPTPAEFDAFGDGQALFCFLVAQKRPELMDFLRHRRITALAFEAVQTGAGRFPLLAPMSTIAGRHAISIGQELLKGIALRRARVIVDVSATIGGAVETIHRLTSHEDPTFCVDGILHYAVPNIPSLAAPDASRALSEALLPYVRTLATEGLSQALEHCPDLRPALFCRDGKLADRWRSTAGP